MNGFSLSHSARDALSSNNNSYSYGYGYGFGCSMSVTITIMAQKRGICPL